MVDKSDKDFVFPLIANIEKNCKAAIESGSFKEFHGKIAPEFEKYQNHLRPILPHKYWFYYHIMIQQ